MKCSVRMLLRLAGMCLTLCSISLIAAERSVRVCVHDEGGRAISGAVVNAEGRSEKSDGTGCAAISLSRSLTILEISHDGFQTVKKELGDGPELDVVLRIAGENTVVEVTAARTPLALDASASSVRTMSAEQLQEAPGFVLDDRLRQVAGFQLFRRTGSWVANPTTQGTSLRGLGSTAASRTLVLSDQVPLNDPFGGWIHWNEIPQMAIRSVELVRGGASDLYGSSAIGGVIDVLPVVPENLNYALQVTGANKSTSIVDGLLAGTVKGWSGLGAATLFRTDGYILTAPESRGAVDVPSNVHSQSGRLEVRHPVGGDGALFLRGNLLNEARSNGTPLQTNATRIWRYSAGGDWNETAAGRFLLRVGSSRVDLQACKLEYSIVSPK